MSQPVANFVRSLTHVLAAVFNDRSAFDRLWRENQLREQPAEPLPLRWEGEWLSEANGHHGELRCFLRRTSATQLEASFRATYARWLRVCYTVALNARQNSSSLRLKGQTDLGMLAGGVYDYEGELTQARFECSYRCKYDHGTFRLKPSK